MIYHLIEHSLLTKLQENNENKKIHKKILHVAEAKRKTVTQEIYEYYTSKLLYNKKYEIFIDPEHKQRLEEAGLWHT